MLNINEDEARKTIKDKLVEIIQIVAHDADNSILINPVNDKKPFRELFDLDSMDFLDIVMELRKRYKVEVPKEEYPMLRTMESSIAYLLPKLYPEFNPASNSQWY